MPDNCALMLSPADRENYSDITVLAEYPIRFTATSSPALD
jgi:hypothetical protein